MVALENALAAALRDIPECLAVGYLDLQANAPLAVQSLDLPSVKLLNNAVLASFFQEHNLHGIEHLYAKTNRTTEDANQHMREMILFSDNLLYVFIRGIRNRSHVGCFVTQARANVAALLTQARQLMPQLELKAV